MKKMHSFTLIFGILVLFSPIHAQLNWDMAKAGDIHRILPERERAEIYNEILAWRLDHILPQIMRREGIDMWLVINFENDEDPVYMSLVARPRFSARRLSILIFHDSPTEGFKKLTANWHGTSTSPVCPGRTPCLPSSSTLTSPTSRPLSTRGYAKRPRSCSSPQLACLASPAYASSPGNCQAGRKS